MINNNVVAKQENGNVKHNIDVPPDIKIVKEKEKYDKK